MLGYYNVKNVSTMSTISDVLDNKMQNLGIQITCLPNLQRFSERCLFLLIPQVVWRMWAHLMTTSPQDVNAQQERRTVICSCKACCHSGLWDFTGRMCESESRMLLHNNKMYKKEWQHKTIFKYLWNTRKLSWFCLNRHTDWLASLRLTLKVKRILSSLGGW